MKWLVIPRFDRLVSSNSVSAALLVLRLIVGVAFILHGFDKIMNPFSWMGPEAPVPGIFQSLAALAEFGGGLAIIFGLFTPLASLALIANMLGALFIVHFPRGDAFIGGYELPLVYLGLFIVLYTTGPGLYSLDHVLFRKHSTTPGHKKGTPRRGQKPAHAH